MPLRREKTSGDSAEEEFAGPAREQRNVERWRMHVLTQAGYPYAEAQRLAMSLHVDLHVACEIVRQGCSPERAADILL